MYIKPFVLSLIEEATLRARRFQVSRKRRGNFIAKITLYYIFCNPEKHTEEHSAFILSYMLRFVRTIFRFEIYHPSA